MLGQDDNKSQIRSEKNKIMGQMTLIQADSKKLQREKLALEVETRQMEKQKISLEFSIKDKKDRLKKLVGKIQATDAEYLRLKRKMQMIK